MHILVINDDGPPSPHSSPYVHSLVRHLQQAGHVVSVCLPHTQRSWIGKAHMIGQTVKPLYYRPGSGLFGSEADGTVHKLPAHSAEVEEWILVDGTPASCAQIGLHHFFADRGPIELVVSGPNYGRNTTAVFALSSGTLGGALEAAVCRKRAIALSFAFFDRNHDPVVIGAACRHSVRVIEALVRQWPNDGSVDLYSVNVPLDPDVEANQTLFAPMLQNYWRDGSCFEEAEAGAAEDGEEEEERIRETEEAAGEAKTEKAEVASVGTKHKHRHFKWNPRFTDVYRSVDEAGEGNDGWTVKERKTSVTPLKANFWHAAPEQHLKALELAETSVEGVSAVDDAVTSAAALHVDAQGLTAPGKPNFFALIHLGDPYIQPLVLSALGRLFPKDSITFLSPPSEPEGEVALAKLLPRENDKILQIAQYEAIDFDYAAQHTQTCLVNSYVIRKALIRKHYLSATVDNWVAKHPASILATNVKRSEHFEVDYAEFLDDALVEAWDLRESMARNAGEGMADEDQARDEEHDWEDGDGETRKPTRDADGSMLVNVDQDQDASSPDYGLVGGGKGYKPPHEREWWILKPGMSDRGQGIKLFSTMDELQAIFDAWEAERPSSEDGDDEEDDDDDDDQEGERVERASLDETGERSGDGQLPENHAAEHPLTDEADEGDYIATSHLRHFVAQPYIDPPLLLAASGRRKFHIRTYVLCVGSLKVYVYRDMLALFAAREYSPPWASLGDSQRQQEQEQEQGQEAPSNNTDRDNVTSPSHSPGATDVAGATNHVQSNISRPSTSGYTSAPPTVIASSSLAPTLPSAAAAAADVAGVNTPSWLSAHLTNTCLQGDLTAAERASSVQPFWQLDGLDAAAKSSIFAQICDLTGEVFEAAARGMTVHFQPLSNGFEVYGLDFLVDAGGRPWLLEANAFPDFKQTGEDLQGLVAVFWHQVLRLAVGSFFAEGDEEDRRKEPLGVDADVVGKVMGQDEKMVLVRHVQLGRR